MLRCSIVYPIPDADLITVITKFQLFTNKKANDDKKANDGLMSVLFILGLWLRLECSLDSLSIVSTDHQIDRGLSVSLRLYEMCHVLVIV